MSFLPSATEVLLLIEQEAGLTSVAGAYTGQLVGRSHECDYPPSITHLPVLTSSRLSPTKDSLEIHLEVQQSLKIGDSLYTMSRPLLEELKPDIILTQSLCDVCSIDVGSVERTIQSLIPRPRVVCLEPTTLAGVMESILKVGKALDLEAAAVSVKSRLEERINKAVHRAQTTTRQKPSIEMLEWLNPIFPGGHWTAEILIIAGGDMTLNLPNDVSRQIEKQALIQADPEFLIVAPCGFSLEVTRSEMKKFVAGNAWVRHLQAARRGNVFLVDGNEHFNRPGPRLVEALEFVVSLLLVEPGAIPEGFPYERFEFSNEMTDETNEIDETPGVVETIDIEVCHATACAQQQLMYLDGSLGLWVMTEYALLKRGTCCGNSCRHCPFGHFNVQENAGNRKRVNKLLKPTLCRLPLSDDDEEAEEEAEEETSATRHVLFWSGGMEQYLALLSLVASGVNRRCITLLTTFDQESEMVPHQQVPLKHIMNQARHLGLDLIAVPLPRQANNEAYVRCVDEGLSLLAGDMKRRCDVRGVQMPELYTVLCFSDLRLEDIRAWRESRHTNAARQQRCHFPLFGVKYEQLEAMLNQHSQATRPTCPDDNWLSHKRIIVSASTGGAATTGDVVDEAFFAKLREANADPLGDDGGFYTCVYF